MPPHDRHIAALAEAHARTHPHGGIREGCDMYGPLPPSPEPPGGKSAEADPTPATGNPPADDLAAGTCDLASAAGADVLGTGLIMPAVAPPPASATTAVAAPGASCARPAPTPARRLGPEDDPLAGFGAKAPVGPPRSPIGGNFGNPLATEGFRRSAQPASGVHVTDYGYRYMDPVTGRWASRDPIGELGGVNLYGFVGNDVVNGFDAFGMRRYELCCTNWEQGYELLGYSDLDSCIHDISDPGAVLDVVIRFPGLLAAAAAASDAPGWLKALKGGANSGSPLTIGSITAIGGAIVIKQWLRFWAADICGRAYCNESERAKQRCIDSNWAFDTWESSCGTGGVLVDKPNETWLWIEPPTRSTYIRWHIF